MYSFVGTPSFIILCWFRSTGKQKIHIDVGVSTNPVLPAEDRVVLSAAGAEMQVT